MARGLEEGGALLPVQVYAEPAAPWTGGERRFFAAIVEQAVVEVRQYARATSPRGTRYLHEALGWIAADERGFDAEGRVTFATACELAGLEPTAVRRRVRAFLQHLPNPNYTLRAQPIGRVIRTYRSARGISQRELARRLRCSHRTVAAVETAPADAKAQPWFVDRCYTLGIM